MQTMNTENTMKTPTVQLAPEIAVSPRMYRLIQRACRRDNGGDLKYYLAEIFDCLRDLDRDNRRINIMESAEQGKTVLEYLQAGSFAERAADMGLTPAEYYEYEKADMLKKTGLHWI